MATAADSLAQNLSFANFSKATDLKKRLWFTVGALIVSGSARSCRFPASTRRPSINSSPRHRAARAGLLQHVLWRRA